MMKVAWIAAVGALGCGSSAGTDGSLQQAGGNGTCTFTVAGATTASGNCAITISELADSNDPGLGIAIASTPNGQLVLGAQIASASALGVTTYTAPAATFVGVYQASANEAFNLSIDRSGNPPLGTAAVAIQSTGASNSAPGVVLWSNAHGTFTATLAGAAVEGADAGSNGLVSVVATF